MFIDVEGSSQGSYNNIFASFDATVADLKPILASKRIIDFPAAQALIYDVCGNLLQDSSKLSFSENFSPSCCRLTCTRPVPRGGGGEDPLSAELAAQWRTVDTGTAFADRLEKRLVSQVSSILASEPSLEAEEELKTSSYDALRRRLPAPTQPITTTSSKLRDTKARFAAAAAPTSACPALGLEIVALLRDVAADLGNTNPSIAEQCAAAVADLHDGVEYLASRAPRVHRHDTHSKQIRNAEASLDLHKKIRAGKVDAYRGFEKHDEMERALNATSLVRKRERERERERGRGSERES